MIEEEFRSLIDSLETVGHYVPTVSDMFKHIRSEKGLLTVDPENPKFWKGYVMVKSEETLDPNHHSPEKRTVFSLDLDLFPGGGRFEEATRKIMDNVGTAAETHYVEMASHFGLRLLTGQNVYRRKTFIVTLPPDEIKEQAKIYQGLVYRIT
jgi:hypothetical protein